MDNKEEYSSFKNKFKDSVFKLFLSLVYCFLYKRPKIWYNRLGICEKK